MPTYNATMADLNNVMWNGPPNSAANHVHTMPATMAQVPFNLLPLKEAKPLKLPKFQQATRDLTKIAGEYDTEDRLKVSYYFSPIQIDLVIQHLGYWNPMLNGRPKEWAQRLLEGIPSPVNYRGFKWRCCGLAYYTPPIVGRRRSWTRTTVAGLELLKYWCHEFPKLKPFFYAYYSREGEREITLDCVDFTLGIMPQRYKDTIASNIRKEAGIKERQIRDATRQAKMDTMMRLQQMQASSSINQITTDAVLIGHQAKMVNTNLTATEVLARYEEKQKRLAAEQALCRGPFGKLIGM